MQSHSGYVLESLMLSGTICTLNQTKQRLMVSVWSSRDQLESSHTSFVISFFICIITSLIRLHAEPWLIVNKTSLDCIVYKYSMSISQDAIPGAKQFYLSPWIKGPGLFCHTDNQFNTYKGGSQTPSGQFPCTLMLLLCSALWWLCWALLSRYIRLFMKTKVLRLCLHDPQPVAWQLELSLLLCILKTLNRYLFNN